MSTRGGVLLASSSGTVFVPATMASHVVHLGAITAVAGLPLPALGVALADGKLVTVIRVGELSAESRPAVVCDLDGESIALAGAEVVAVGAFDSDGGGVVHEGRRVPDFDARGLYAELEGTLWAARALSAARRRAEDEGGAP